MRGSKGFTEPAAASTERAPETSAGEEEVLGVEEVEEGERRGDLGAVQERQPLLGRQGEGGEAGPAQPLDRREPLLTHRDLADAEEHRGEVGEGREVPRGAHRALLRDDRQDVGPVEGEERLDDLAAHPGVAAGQAGDLEGDDEADDRRRERLPDPDRVGEDEVPLEELELLGRDVGRGEAAEAGVDAVGRLAAGHDGGDGRRPRVDGRQGGGIEVEGLAAAGDAAQVGEGEVAGAQEHGPEGGTPKLSRQVGAPEG